MTDIQWMCHDCAQKLCKGMPEGRLATYHEGKCDACGKEKIVTEPRDYRYWKESQK